MPDPSSQPSPPSETAGIQVALVVLILFATFAVLKAAQVVFLPIALVLFMAILVRPPIAFLNRWLPNYLSMAIVLLVVGAGLFGGWTLLAASGQSFADRAPIYFTRVMELGEAGLTWVAEHGVEVVPSIEELGVQKVFNWTMQVVRASLVPIFSFIGVSVLVTIMLVLLLLEIDQFKDRLESAFEGHAVEVAASVSQATSQFQRFVFLKTVISLATGTATALCCWALGLDFPFLWGMLAFLLNFIPNIGSIIAVIPPVLLAMLQFDHLSQALVAFIGLGTIQVVIGNFIDPRVVGRSLSLSPFVVFTGMLFWGWMWGIVGVFLAVPLTVAMRLTFAYVTPLRPVAIMMGGPGADPQASVTKLASPAAEPATPDAAS